MISIFYNETHRKCSVLTGSRIHLSLLDMHGGLGRVDMGIGLALAEPGWKITVADSSETKVKWLSEFPDRSDEIYQLLKIILHKFNIKSISIVIEAGIPPHVGLGSTTQLYMAIAQGLNHLAETHFSMEKLAMIVRRGGTSGIGIHRISNNGLILDSGHKFGKEKNCFGTSHFLTKVPPPSLICSLKFPADRILYIVPRIKGIYGNEERDIFESKCPIEEKEVEKCCRIIFCQILAGVAEQNLEIVCEGIDNLQEVGFKRIEIDSYGSQIWNLICHIRKLGGIGVGMSSFGPGIYILSGNWSLIQEWVGNNRDIIDRNSIYRVANNS